MAEMISDIIENKDAGSEIATKLDVEQVDWDKFPDMYDEISKFVFAGKYARYQEELGRRETFEEAVGRVEEMHLNRFSELSEEHKAEIQAAFDLVRDRRVGPSMRSFQFAGKAIESNHLRSYNCAVRHVDSIRSFAEIFFLLLCGSGVGIGLTSKYLNRLPDLVDASNKTGTVIAYVIEDTIEGWSDSLEALMSCYFVNTPLTGRKIVFDYSKIRPAGSPLKTSGGKAPGHEGLKAAHIKIKALLDHIVEVNRQERMRSVDAYDILMHTSDAVLSGGVRRSACSVMFDWHDEDMINAKTGNWFEDNPQRARSNNSVMLNRHTITKEEFLEIYKRTKEWGEPGFVFVENEDTLLNPCFEIGFKPVTEDGVAGVQVCNLTTINGAKVNSEQDFYESVAAASLIGTLQASYTDFPYLTNAAEYLTREEALLGVSMTGMMESPDITFDPVIQWRGAEIVKEVNERWAGILGINPAARTTCIKPEGSSSLAYGTMASGIHASHAPLMWRRIQANKLDNVYQHFKMHNPHLCEESVWSANRTDDVVSFPVRVRQGSIFKDDLSAIAHLEMAKSTQQNWVMPGRRPDSDQDLMHNVSLTCLVDDDEWDEVADYLFENRHIFTAVSLLSRKGDKDYPQSPNEAVVTNEELELFVSQLNNYMPVDYSWMKEDQDNTDLQGEAACAGPNASCEVSAI